MSEQLKESPYNAEDRQLWEWSNSEFVDYLMNNSVHGPLTQSYVIEAIRFYSERVTAMPEPESNDKEFIDPKLWHQIASWVIGKVKRKYEEKPRSLYG